MTSGHWRRIEQIYDAALQRAPSERGAFLDAACGEDEALRREVAQLLAANDQAGDFLASPAWEVAPSVLVATMMTNDRDTSLVGKPVGHYQILAPLGRGGMGEVYRARDTKLNREVALKVLPDIFALDRDRLARFKREAHMLASLNHPNIAAIYGFEDAGEVKALVLELVEGPTLADRIARGRLDVDEALPIARQIAEALESAHERGIVHRDLKPANVKVRTDGVVKVLDFGLAKAFEVESSGGASQSPTAASAVVTADGIIVGTPAYMAPEQARGKPADRRTDLWALGCVLYEMLTGRRAFTGAATSETLAAVIRDNPDWSALPNETPPSIRRLLRRCLAKDPKSRLSDAPGARIEIDDAFAEPRLDASSTRITSRRKERFAWAAALALVAAIATAAIVWARRPAPTLGEMRFEITTPPTTGLGGLSVAISPDGRRIVFVATSEGVQKLWMRSLDSDRAAVLAGTDGATAPFWAPDSRTVAFFTATDNQLKRIDIENGSLNVVATVPLGTGGTWNKDGTILFSHLAGSAGISRVSAQGGQASEVTRVGKEEPGHQFPQFLPDGRHFLYYTLDAKLPGVRVGQLDGSETKRLLDADGPAVFVPAGYLLFPRQGTLFAQAFDPVRLALTGNPFRVAEHVASELGALSASVTGTLVFRTGSTVDVERRPLVWFDRSGNQIGIVDTPVSGWRPSLSPDGRRVALMGGEQAGPPDIYLVTVDRGVPTRFTTNGAVNLDPIWSPDGSRIVFSKSDWPTRPAIFQLYWKPAAGNRNEELLLATPPDNVESLGASDWSRQGFLLYNEYDPKTSGIDILAFPVNGDRTPVPVVETRFEERDAQFSPDGNWIAYQSDESGRFEIYVQRFPRGRSVRISATGGAQVRWPREGKELFYIAMDGRLMAVPIRITTDDIDPGSPMPLFPTRVGGAVQGGLNRQQYVVTADGQRFLMSTIQEVNPSPIEVILNWKPQP
jgi:Tol biopolymer transport system component